MKNTVSGSPGGLDIGDPRPLQDQAPAANRKLATSQGEHPAVGASMVQPDEPHYTLDQIAKWWNLDVESVRRMFKAEPGVLRFGNARSTPRKRAHTTLRIPRSILERVHRRMLNAERC